MLLKLMKYAEENIPYYKKIFNEYNVNVNKIEDFFKIPILNKSDIQQNYEQFDFLLFHSTKPRLAFSLSS